MKKLELKTLNIISKKNSKSVIELELTASYTFMASNKRDDVCRKEEEVRGEKAGGYFFVNNCKEDKREPPKHELQNIGDGRGGGARW